MFENLNISARIAEFENNKKKNPHYDALFIPQHTLTQIYNKLCINNIAKLQT